MPGDKIILYADDQRKEDFSSRALPEKFQILYNRVIFKSDVDCAAYFLLNDISPEQFSTVLLKPGQPVFVDGVNYKLDDFPQTNPLAIINAWPGFLKNELLEISFKEQHKSQIEDFLNKVGWKFTRIADQVGLAVPRVISMIINEACYAVAEKVSTPEEIDISMKIGTNYPYGPFEWSKIIGAKRIISLLEILQKEDGRYKPAPGIHEILNTN